MLVFFKKARSSLQILTFDYKTYNPLNLHRLRLDANISNSHITPVTLFYSFIMYISG